MHIVSTIRAVKMWEGVTYVVDPITGRWVEEPAPGHVADIA